MPKTVFSDAYRELLRRIILLRKTHRVSQVELARRLGRPQPFVSYLERGERRIDVVEYVAVVKAIGGDPVTEFASLVAVLPDEVSI